MKSRPWSVAPPLQSILLSGAAVLAVVLAGLQVGGSGESLVVLAVAGALLLLLALTHPQWLIFLGAALGFAGGYALIGIPVPEVGAVLIIIGTVATQRDRWSIPEPVLILVPLLLAWALFAAWPTISQPDVNKRLLSVALWALLIAVVSLPGVTRHYIARGLLAGLLISLPAGALVGSDYGTRLAGLVSDPNFFAMVVAVTTPLIVGELGLLKWRAAGLWAFSALLVVLADSRTGMMSLAIALLVFSTVQWLRGWAVAIPVLGLLTVRSLPDDVVRGGRWEERQGSDALRESIGVASSRQIAESPWIGHGLGRGVVDLAVYGDPPRDLTFFQHNSYKLLVTEMGLVGMGLYTMLAIGALVAAIRGEVAKGPVAAIAAAGVMATQLGEVLFSVPMALALGFAWASAGSASEGELVQGTHDRKFNATEFSPAGEAM